MKLFLQVLFFVLCAVVVIGIVVFVVTLIYRKKYYPKNYKNVCYLTVKKIVDKYDFRLINKYHVRIEERKIGILDHVIFGDKYIYIVLSYYFNGILSTKNVKDNSWIFTNEKGVKHYNDNLYDVLEYMITRLITDTGLPRSLLVGIVATDDYTKLDIDKCEKPYHIVHKNKLKRLIREYESRDIPNISESNLQAAILTLDKINKSLTRK